TIGHADPVQGWEKQATRAGGQAKPRCRSGLEAAAAAARAGGVGILEYEPAAHHLVLEIDLHPVEVDIRLHVNEDLHTLALQLLIHLALLIFRQVEHIAEAGAPATFHTDAQ